MTDVPPRGTTVLYVAAAARSGSTLLTRMLGQLPGHVPVGELVDVWERGVRADQHCACGERFASCPFWSAVGTRAFGGWDQVDLADVLALKRRVDRSAWIPLLLAPRLMPPFRRRLHRYADVLARLYTAVAEVAGASTVVDSSKTVSSAFVLRHAPGVRVQVAHLVRDPRGVAYSWSRRVHRPEKAEERQYSRIWPPRLVARRWLTVNLLVDVLRGVGVPVARVRYEDLVVDPRREVARVTEILGRRVPEAALEHLRVGEVDFAPSHIPAGNRNRFRTGTVALRSDEAWRESLPRSSRRTVELLTWPFRRRYGYAR